MKQEFPPQKFSAGKVYLAKGFRKHAIRIHAALESHPWLSKVCESLLPDRPCWRDQSVRRVPLMKQRGYTLIEVMIALVVFAMIAAISSGVMYHVFDIRKRVAIQANQFGELQLAAGLIQHDMVQYVPRTVHSGDMHVFSSFVGTYQYMEFTRGGLVNPKAEAKRSGLKRVAYVCSQHELVRRTWEALDTPERHNYEDRVVLSHLASCTFAYVSAYQQIMPEWRAYKVEENQKIQAIPSGVQLTVDPFGWGKMTFLFVIPEGLYAA